MQYFSRHSFGKILELGKHDVKVENLDGMQWTVSRKIFDEEFDINDQYSDTKKVTRTELIDLVTSSPYLIMQVNFNKQVKESEVKKKLHALYPNKGSLLSESDFKKECNNILSEVLNGESRTLNGFHKGKKDGTGRIYFFDMETVKGDVKQPEFRLVDPRNLNWAIIQETKYVTE